MSTIVAISTAIGNGGIGIIRISGEKAFNILEKIFVPKDKKEPKGNVIKYGNIIEPNSGNIIDEVLVSYFKAPKSYTTENMCEINAHGGMIVVERILKLCLENGANLAEPGEFTKRAFLNGRIDLVQAESVMDIINSKSSNEQKNAVEQLRGGLSEKISKINNELLNVMLEIEVAIDYPEYDEVEIQKEQILKRLYSACKETEKIKRGFEGGKILKEGIKVAIIGKPNAGKSSLLNTILNEERAIVTDKEGTTRDTIEEYINVKGIPVKIIDTAGIRKANDEVEKIGIEKTREKIETADFIIAIFDATRKLDTEDREILKILQDKQRYHCT